MTDTLISPSFPNGIGELRTEQQVRVHRLSMADVISLGAAQAARASKHKGCPFCGADPLIPTQVMGRYVIECENDDCFASVSVAGDTLADALARWNNRA